MKSEMQNAECRMRGVVTCFVILSEAKDPEIVEAV